MDGWSSPVYDHTQAVGLEGDTRKIKDWLFEAKDGLPAIGIVGMGGLAKTKIAQKVFNEREIENHFDRRIWIFVSQTFNEELIMISILRNLGDANVGDDYRELLRKINQYLLGKRTCAGLPKCKGSSTIITTRILKVARKMEGKEAKIHIPKFLTFAGNKGRCPNSELEVIGKEIVEKCKGLPLAIKTVGGMMLYKPPHLREWQKTTERFREELAEIDDFVMVSLQIIDKTYNKTIKTCNIHDMVRDLVIKVVDDDAFFKPSGINSRHLGITSEIKTKYLSANLKLRALLSTTKTAEVNKIASTIAKKLIECQYICEFRPARSNRSEGCRTSEFNNEVHALKNLRELQFLSISYFDSHGSDLIAKVDKLCPPQQLDELCLNCFPGKMSPIWLNPVSLPMLRYLSVSSGNIAEMHQSFWGEKNNVVWQIEALKLESLSYLGIEWMTLQEVMPLLQIVNVSWCPQLESFPIEDVGFRGGVWTKEEH
ncbi:hypothetical protein ACOSP7_022802 [Xanthoceras sorbifolium]